jgi:SAM-dependent MidA family methyltransferase
MLSEIERENVTKAAQCAALLVSDIKIQQPFLAELGLDALKMASELDQRLKRLEAVSNVE